MIGKTVRICLPMDVLKRLLIHNRKDAKDSRERTMVVVGKNENLTKSHVRALESRLTSLVTWDHHPATMNHPGWGGGDTALSSIPPAASRHFQPSGQT